jgi:hypothetical protein
MNFHGVLSRQMLAAGAAAFLLVGGIWSYRHASHQRDLKNLVWDQRTQLLWANKDNGFNINAMGAKNYCTSLSLAGISGWRLPRLDELGTLFDAERTAFYKDDGRDRPYHARQTVFLSNEYEWSSNGDSKDWKDAYGFSFDDGNPNALPGNDITNARALCVHDALPHGIF